MTFLCCLRYKEAFDDSEYVATMPDEDGDDDDSPVESEWGVPAAGEGDSDVEAASRARPRGSEQEDK